MKKKTVKYTQEPIDARVIEDFLPPPHALVKKDAQVKVTMTLSKKSIDFFKRQAAREHVGYQTMIRALVDNYTRRFDA